jgi:periplasmic protein TonB
MNQKPILTMKTRSIPEMGLLSLVACIAALLATAQAHAMGEATMPSSTLPTPIFRPSPKYTVPMRYDQVHGTVEVSFVVDSKGDVVAPRILSAKDPRMAESALAAVRSWKYRPALRNGAPVPCLMIENINFPVFDAQDH